MSAREVLHAAAASAALAAGTVAWFWAAWIVEIALGG